MNRASDTKRAGRALGLALTVVLAAIAPLAGQTGPGKRPSARILLSQGGQDRAQQALVGQAVRAIDDPCTGAQWLLVRDAEFPAGPGRLLLVAGPQSGLRQVPSSIAPQSVIRAGDRLVVEESSAVVEARLEGVALGPAIAGAAFEVRLRIGGRVVRAIALGPGRAALAAEAEARP